MLPMLADGRLSLATVRLIASHLTAANQQELLAQASSKSKRAVEEMLVRHFPRPDVPSSVRKLPSVQPPHLSTAGAPVASAARLPPAPAPPIRPRRPAVAPLAPERYEVRVTVSAEAREDLREAQDLLRHAIPSGDPAQVIERALRLLVTQLRRQKYAFTEHPRPSRGTAPGSRDIAARVRRGVGSRDDGRCTFVGKNGRRCNERALVEFHHGEPYGIGGESTIANIKLLCRAHNAYESERFYGRALSSRWRTLPGKSAPALPP